MKTNSIVLNLTKKENEKSVFDWAGKAQNLKNMLIQNAFYTPYRTYNRKNEMRYDYDFG